MARMSMAADGKSKSSLAKCRISYLASMTIRGPTSEVACSGCNWKAGRRRHQLSSLVPGCDAHINPDLVSQLKSGSALTLNDSRYVLVEPPHHILPPKIDQLFFDLLAAGYKNARSHPPGTCMSWVDRNEELLNRLVLSGVWMQMTAGRNHWWVW